MIVGVPREIFPGERRVALVPAVIPNLTKAGLEVIIEAGAGVEAGYPDADYAAKGATDRRRSRRGLSPPPTSSSRCCATARMTSPAKPIFRCCASGQVLIGFLRPLGDVHTVQEIAATGATSFSVELMPRTTRAQSMDALSSMGTICGYKAVLLAADTLPRIFPMLTTAAGTITPARVLVMGAGVAGLQAIATARRLGAVVSAYDLRPAVKEQVQSLGGRFVELAIEVKDAQDAGGYAKAQDEVVLPAPARVARASRRRSSDVVITAAVIPGKKSPILVTKEMVAAMAPGSVIVDLAAERGGNCELTRTGEKVVEHGVTIIGSINLASTVPYHASQMYAKNLTNFLLNMVKDGKLNLNMEDEIVRSTLVTEGGEIVNPRVREFFSLPALVAQT